MFSKLKKGKDLMKMSMTSEILAYFIHSVHYKTKKRFLPCLNYHLSKGTTLCVVSTMFSVLFMFSVGSRVDQSGTHSRFQADTLLSGRFLSSRLGS